MSAGNNQERRQVPGELSLKWMFGAILFFLLLDAALYKAVASIFQDHSSRAVTLEQIQQATNALGARLSASERELANTQGELAVQTESLQEIAKQLAAAGRSSVSPAELERIIQRLGRLEAEIAKLRQPARP